MPFHSVAIVSISCVFIIIGKLRTNVSIASLAIFFIAYDAWQCAFDSVGKGDVESFSYHTSSCCTSLYMSSNDFRLESVNGCFAPKLKLAHFTDSPKSTYPYSPIRSFCRLYAGAVPVGTNLSKSA